jgi:hypothetical protein
MHLSAYPTPAMTFKANSLLKALAVRLPRAFLPKYIRDALTRLGRQKELELDYFQPAANPGQLSITIRVVDCGSGGDVLAEL